MEKPYLRKLETVGDFDVWEVDGMYIRNEINREFTNFGQHYRFPFIPKHQFWIDKEHTNNETSYYVDHMLMEWHLMNQGVGYDTAITKADNRELLERKKSALIEKVKKGIQHSSGKISKEVYIHKLASSGPIQIWIVNGEIVRGMYFIDFTEGGHHFVYNFVPHDEIWLDSDLVPKEREYVLVHELHERYLMYKGWTYTHAHNSSSYLEYKCRRNPTLLDKYLAKEMANNKLVT